MRPPFLSQIDFIFVCTCVFFFWGSSCISVSTSTGAFIPLTYLLALLIIYLLKWISQVVLCFLFLPFYHTRLFFRGEPRTFYRKPVCFSSYTVFSSGRPLYLTVYWLITFFWMSEKEDRNMASSQWRSLASNTTSLTSAVNALLDDCDGSFFPHDFVSLQWLNGLQYGMIIMPLSFSSFESLSAVLVDVDWSGRQISFGSCRRKVRRSCAIIRLRSFCVDCYLC